MDAQYYLSRAAELDEVAGKFEAPEHQAEYRAMAASWRRLAADLASAERGDSRALDFPS
ncbi:MAG TPA: hypothetical protein VD906_09525 [Caulobacteraceae bacterium]|nr:hypothetical protein [Caulobacteraceae bacterium]